MDLLTNPQEVIDEIGKQSELEKEISDLRHTAWDEKYRPKKLDDVILPDSIKNNIKSKYKNNSFQNMIFHSGSPGTGKTTVARIIPEEHGCDYMFVRSASESRIDLVDAIASYGMQISVDNKPRFVIIDEGDAVPGNNIRPFYAALQPLIEATSSTLRFIITCNHLHLIPEAIRSRCIPISFSHNDESIKKPMWKKLQQIADMETTKSGGHVNPETLKQIAKLNYPDMRAMINNMQYNFDSNNGSIDGEIVSISLEHIKNIWQLIKENNEILPVRKYYTEHISDLNGIFTPFLDYIIENDYIYAKPYLLSIASIVSTHQFWSAFDRTEPEVNICGMISKIISLLHPNE